MTRKDIIEEYVKTYVAKRLSLDRSNYKEFPEEFECKPDFKKLKKKHEEEARQNADRAAKKVDWSLLKGGDEAMVKRQFVFAVLNESIVK